MENKMELHQVIRSILETQIQFGIYRCGERLPTIEEASQLFLVSADTVRIAYQYLKQKGYITLSKSVGTKVKVQYSGQDIERNIQTFFACRKDALIDLSYAMKPLFTHAQWLGFKTASTKMLEEIESLAKHKELLPPYTMIRHLQQIYGPMGNDLLIRLIWQSFMFFQALFFSISDNSNKLREENTPLLHMVALTRQKNWSELWSATENYQEMLTSALCRFFGDKVTISHSEPQIAFAWNGYKKASQRCYSLAMELLIEITRGTKPVGTFLPSLEKISREKQVSVSTVRRTLSVLNSIGMTKSVNGVGTQILPPQEIPEQCDFSHPVVKSRLSDYVQSLHIIALSCKDVAKVTIDSMDASAIKKVIDRLLLLQRMQRYELAAYGILELVTHYAPYQAIRTIYSQLFQLLLWGYPLRSLRKPEIAEAIYRPYFEYFLDFLKRSDTQQLAAKLEELLLIELKTVVNQLTQLGIIEADAIVIP